MTASIMAINSGLKTAQMVASEQGLDIEDIYLQLSQEQKLRDKFEIKTSFDATMIIAEGQAGTND
jgi:capsid protein